MDLLLCPCAPAAGVPHSFPLWWGYTTLWNILDLPSIIVPLKGFRIDLLKDAKVKDYQPRANPFDKENWQICKLPNGQRMGKTDKISQMIQNCGQINP